VAACSADYDRSVTPRSRPARDQRQGRPPGSPRKPVMDIDVTPVVDDAESARVARDIVRSQAG